MAKKVLSGRVESAKMQKTVVVSVSVLRKHKLYGKIVRREKSYKAHVPDGLEVSAGDLILMEEIRPVSRDKRWVVKKVL